MTDQPRSERKTQNRIVTLFTHRPAKLRTYQLLRYPVRVQVVPVNRTRTSISSTLSPLLLR